MTARKQGAVTLDVGEDGHAAVTAAAEAAGVTRQALVRQIVRDYFGLPNDVDRIRATRVQAPR